MSQESIDNGKCISSIPLKYTFYTRPAASSTNAILYETNSGVPHFWRNTPDTGETDSKDAFWDSVRDHQIVDCLPQLEKALENVNTEVEARISQERLDQGIVLLTLQANAFDTMYKTRAAMLRAYFQVGRIVIPIAEDQVYNDAKELDGDLIAKLGDISKFAKVSIFVTDFVPIEPKIVGLDTKSTTYATIEEATASTVSGKPYYIIVYGDTDASKYAEIKIRVVLDHLQGKFVDNLDLELSVQTLVAGSQGGNLASVEEQSNARVYFGPPLSELFGSQYEIDTSRDYNCVHITGEEPNVALAKSLIKEIVARTPLLCKDCVLNFAKLDIIALKYQPKLLDIMTHHGTFIQIPYLGAERSLVRVQGATDQSIDDTIAALMEIATQLFQVSYCIHSGITDENGTLVPPKVGVSMDTVEKIAGSSGAIVSCKLGTSFDMLGYRGDAKRAAGIVRSLPVLEEYEHQVSFKLELPIDLRDFISGKGNGKTHRIMKNSNVWIKFSPFNEHNFFVTLTADDYNHAAAGIQLLEDELPAETCFFIEEAFHRQIIGTGGSKIQGIMRKHNVFIKFSHNFEGYPNGFSFLRLDNVIIRCPAKNGKSIPLAKQELLETVEERAKEYYNTYIYISRANRRILLSERLKAIYEIERKTGSIVDLPQKEDPTSPGKLVEIRGPSNSSESAAGMLKAVLPDEYEFKVAQSPSFQAAVDEKGGEFRRRVVVPFRVALKVETQVIQAGEGTNDGPFHRIVLSFSQEHSASLEQAIQVLTAYLREHDIDIVDRGELHDDPVEHGTAATLGYQKKSSKPNRPGRTEFSGPPLRERNNRSRSPPRRDYGSNGGFGVNYPGPPPIAVPQGLGRQYQQFDNDGGYDPNWSNRSYQARPERYDRGYY